ncbi:hypothetical protein LZ31DRAFT_614322 [Colletotrichum somersetense]|nr:hypothetical protein LZ31DRAFT_614322 [Colletotrichum somersetense]
MALMEHTLPPQAWGRWQPYADKDYAWVDNSTFVQYDSRATTSAPMNGALIVPRSMVAPQYNMTQMPAMGHQFQNQNQNQNQFAYAEYNPPQASTSIPVRTPVSQDRPLRPAAAPVEEDDVLCPSSYPQETSSAQNDRHLTSSRPSETTMSNPKTPHPLNTKEVKFNKPTSADPVNFTTAIDTLMKAIQKKPHSENVKLEPMSPPRSLAGYTASVPASAPTAKEPADAPKLKRYICDVDGCGKSFYQSTHLDTHRRAHTGEKPYQCNWPRCGRTFSQPGNLKTHMRRHTGEKPFRCEKCSKMFAQRGNLQAHMVTHDNAKPFLCRLDDCKKMFTQRGNLKNHQNKYHKKTLMEMTDLVVSISDIDDMSDKQREMYWYFANLYKNSNKGIKGRGKERRVSNRGAQPRRALSSCPVKRVTGPTSLAAYSSKRLPPTEQYMQQQQQQHRYQHSYEAYDADMDHYTMQ